MIVPVTYRLIIKQQKLENTSTEYKRAQAMGLVIPDTEDKQRAQAGVDVGHVVAFGPTVFVEYGTENPLKVGDLVAFAKYSGKEIVDPDDGEVYVALNDADIVAIIKETKNG